MTSGIAMLELQTSDLPTFQSVVAVAVEDKAVHMFEKIARHFGHLFRRSSKFGRARSGALREFTHLLHGADNRLRAAGLFFHCRRDLMRDLVQASGGTGDLGGTMGLLVGSRTDLLCKLEDFGDHVGDLLE